MVSREQLFRDVERNEGEIVGLLRQLIRFQTVNTGVMPTGDELPLCQFLQQKLAGEGIEGQIFQTAENRGNLVARLAGRAGTPRLLLMSHTDVVPVGDESQWVYPPFEGVAAEGRVWGRGAADMKDMLAAEIAAMIILKRAGVELKGDLILAAAADEETGGEYGFGWLVRNAPESIQADYALNEGGGTPIVTENGLAYIVPTGEKGRLEVRITLRGRSTHAASPWLGDNVSFKLAEVLKRLADYQPELDVSHPFFTHLMPALGREETITIENVNALSDELLTSHVLLGSFLRGYSRMTFTPTMFQGGVKSNSVPDECYLTCDVRTLPGQDEAHVRREVEKVLAGIEGASYELTCTAVPSASPFDTELARALGRATQAAACRSDIIFLPGMTMGFTDSRLVRPLGVTIYGFTPNQPEVDPKVQSNMHGANESTDIRSLLFKAKVYISVALDLLT